jgi:lipopolysaccharide transport system ATP-binding protein
MPEDILIKVEGVSKKFCRDLKTSLWYGMKDMASELTGRKIDPDRSLRNHEFWAVQDISFELKRGECLGLIGRNGAGKSTLLKMLNGLIKPDKGRIEIKGRVGAMIALGAGFNPILTGRENIYVNASVLGLTKHEIDSKLDQIIEFSEIGEFIDTPVQNYSSGMMVRLGFSIASQIEPDILLIDEVLAVGDMGFVLKCFNKMDELFSRTSLVFVSHNMPQISRICTDLIVMTRGKSIFHSNDVSQGIGHYYDLFDQLPGNFTGTGEAELEELYLTSGSKDSRQIDSFSINHLDDLNVHIKIRINKPLTNPNIGLMFYDKEQRNFGEVFNFKDLIKVDVATESLAVVARFPQIQMGQGLFSITVGLTDFPGGVRKSIFRMQSAIYFKVISKKQGWAPMQFNPEWELESKV